MDKRAMILRPLGLALLLAVGIGVVWAVAVLWALSVAGQFIRRAGVTEQLEIRVDGTPIIRTYEFGDLLTRTWRTLEGDPVPEKRSPSEVGYLSGPSLIGAQPPQRAFTIIPWEQRIVWVSDTGDWPTRSWFLIYEAERTSRGCFVGYDLKTKRRIGYIGRQGFRDELPPEEERFEIDGRRMSDRPWIYGLCTVSGPYGSPPEEVSGKGWMVYLISGDELLEVNVQTRSVRVMLKSPGLMAVGLAQRAIASLPADEHYRVTRLPRNVVVRFEERIVVIDPREGDQRQYVVPAAMRHAAFEFYELADGTALIESTRRDRGGWRTRLYWIDGTERVVRQNELLLRMPRRESLTTRTWATVLAFPSPLAATAAAVVGRPLGHLSMGREKEYSAALRRSLSEMWPALLVLLFVAAALAWACGRRQRQYGMQWTPVWVGFVFLGGVPGLLGYLFYRSWPCSLACPACGREAPRDRQSCFACGEQFAEPALKGTEVFA